MPLNIEFIAINPSEKERVETLESTFETLKSERDGLDRQLAEMTLARDKVQSELQTVQKLSLEDKEAIANLSARVLELQKIPPVTLPITRKPTITKTEIINVAGVAVPKGNAPSAAQDQNARDLLLTSSMMGLNAWRGFFNLQEVKAHTAMADSNPNHLPGYGRRLGMTTVFDTLNNPAVNYSDSDLKLYLDGLRKMAGVGPFVGYFDDANQYLDETKYPKGTLERLVGRIRQFAPDIILIASLTANAAIGQYKPLFDHVEAQTFGRITELEIFLQRGFDVYCLDGRKEISVDYLTKSIEIIAQYKPRNVFYYITSITDWKTIPEKLPIIKQVVTRWMSMAR